MSTSIATVYLEDNVNDPAPSVPLRRDTSPKYDEPQSYLGESG
jgi:hypothetical protein